MGLDEKDAPLVEARINALREAKLRKAASGAGLTTPDTTLSPGEIDSLGLPETAPPPAPVKAPAKASPAGCLDCGGTLTRLGRGFRCLACRPLGKRPRKERPAIEPPAPARAASAPADPAPTVARGTALAVDADLALALCRAEARALAELVELLAPLPAEARRRVVEWAGSRFGEEG